MDGMPLESEMESNVRVKLLKKGTICEECGPNLWVCSCYMTMSN